MPFSKIILTFCTLLCVTASFYGCSSEIDVKAGLPQAEVVNDPNLLSCSEYQPVPAYSYANKVKLLINGKALTQEELAQTQSNPRRIEPLIDAWLDTPEADEKLMNFFQVTFQQGEDSRDLRDLFNINTGRLSSASNHGTGGLIIQNYQESFARTALHFYKNERSFAELMTTDEFMMTSAMALAMGYNEYVGREPGRSSSKYTPGRDLPLLKFVRNANIPIEESLDPEHSNFWTFDMDAYDEWWPDCISGNTITIRENYQKTFQYRWAAQIPLGAAATVRQGQTVEPCASGQSTFQNIFPPVGLEAVRDWKLTKIIPSTDDNYMGIDAYVAFKRNQPLRFKSNRKGFYTTPAFLQIWRTNETNSFRVNANQAIIVGIGSAFESNENLNLSPAEVEALDDLHASPGTPCFGCHQSLDPIRQIFLKNFNTENSPQRDDELGAPSAFFSYKGQQGPMNQLEDLGLMLASHPDFAESWVQKLCIYANSSKCYVESQEFKVLVQNFENSGYNFKQLLKDFFASAIVTGNQCVASANNKSLGKGDQGSITRKFHFCHTLSTRLGIKDLCGLRVDEENGTVGLQFIIGNMSQALPSDLFARGEATITSITEPGMLPRIMRDKICEKLSENVVGGGKLFDGSNPETDIASMLTDLAGIPNNDPRYNPMFNELENHYQDARQDVSVSRALQSTFMVTCMSPNLTGVGI